MLPAARAGRGETIQVEWDGVVITLGHGSDELLSC